MNPYNEPFYTDVADPQFAETYRLGKTPPNSDMIVWGARQEADYCGGLSQEVALAKHNDECREMLGLSFVGPSIRPNPPSPVVYDEQFFLTVSAPDYAKAYATAQQPIDTMMMIWGAREQRDAVEMIATGTPQASAYQLSHAKHLRECFILLGIAPPFPAPPTREQVCSMRMLFQGRMVTTQAFGEQPWFEIALQCIADANDRASVYAQKRVPWGPENLPDTHVIIEFFTHQGSIYDEPNQPWQQAITQVGEFNQPGFLALVEEAILAGFIPVVVYDGDNGDHPEDGYPNALRQLPILKALLASSVYGDLNQYVLYARFWDGVFYGSDPANIKNFGAQFRKILQNGYLALEHDPGHIPVGGGEADYQPNGRVCDYDVICGEYQYPQGQPFQVPPIIGATWDVEHNQYVPKFASDASSWMQMWQVFGRMLATFKRPADMPMNFLTTALDGPQQGQGVRVNADSSNPPFYLASGSARGPYFYVMFEKGLYQFVRRQSTPQDHANIRAAVQAMGCPLVC